MYIPLDRDSPRPLVRQIAGYLEELIRRGLLDAGGRLPATRALAAEIGVNRKTVESAYEELAARGLVRMRAGRGVEVAARIPEDPELELGLPEPRHRDPLPRDAWLEPEGPDRPLDLSGAGPRLTVLTSRQLRALHRAAAADRRAPLFTPPPPLGDSALRAAAARHFARCGVLAEPDEVAIVPGRRAALERLLTVFVPRGGSVLLDGLVDPELAAALAGRRARTVVVPESGRLPRTGARRGASLLVVGAAGSRLPGAPPGIARRRALLDLAREAGVPVVEDVSRAEETAPDAPPPLAVLDPSGRVFALADLSDEAGGRYGAAAIAGMPKAIDRLRSLADPADGTLDRIAQRMLAGALDAPGRSRNRRALAERRRLLVPALRRSLRRRLAEAPGHEFNAGADAVRVDLPEGIRGRAVRDAAADAGVRVHAAADCGASAARDTFLLLDLTRHEEGDLLEGIRRLGEALDRALDHST